MPFNDPIVGGTTLVIPSIHSKNYQAGNTGWTINADGTAEFNGVIVRGNVVLGNGTTNTIILDSSRNAIFEYDSAGHLVGSWSPTAGTDSFGNAYQSGMVQYLAGNVAQYSRLFVDGSIQLNVPSNTRPAVISGTSTPIGPNNDQLAVGLNSPSFDTNGNIFGSVAVYSGNSGATEDPMVWMGMFDGNVTPHYHDIDVIVAGNLKYAVPNGPLAPVRETWHDVSFGANWSNAGAPYSNVQYMRDTMGFICLRGVAQFTGTDTAPSFVFTLPVGYRPTKDQSFVSSNVPSGDATPAQCRNVHIFSASNISNPGLVVTTNFSGTINPGPVSFDNIRFPLV